jgi:hypothetical protein
MKKKKSSDGGTSMQALLAAQKQLEKALLFDVAAEAASAESGTDSHGFENIVGVGIGDKMSEGNYTGEQCVTVYVVAKAPKKQVQSDAVVPSSVDGIPTDVVAIGIPEAFPFRGRYRPAKGGVSVGHVKITAGTLGCMVASGAKRYILSNNHVLANSNSGKLGDAIVQPGPYDGGHAPADTIARLSKFVPIKFGGVLTNLVDCAIAETTTALVSPKNISYGTLSTSPVQPSLNLLVKKAGRTTQFTRGRIVGVNVTINVNYGTAGVARFVSQMLIQSLTANPFSAGGDSGSLIVSDSGNRPVGLLFAGSSTHTIANSITSVLSALSVSIVA